VEGRKLKKKELVVLWIQRTYMVSFSGPITYFSAQNHKRFFALLPLEAKKINFDV
jgi:hypothetical protein